MKTHVGGAMVAAAAACTITPANAFTAPFAGILRERVSKLRMPPDPSQYPWTLMKSTDVSHKAVASRPVTSRLFMSTPSPRVYIPLELEGELDSDKEWEIEMELNGNKQVFKVKEGTSVLEAAKVVYDDPPHSCQQGVCTTCAGLIRSGEEGIDYKVAVDTLSSSQKAQGFTLTCQTFPCGPGLKVLLNQYDKVYEEQYGQYELKEKRTGFMGMF